MLKRKIKDIDAEELQNFKYLKISEKNHQKVIVVYTCMIHSHDKGICDLYDCQGNGYIEFKYNPILDYLN